MTMSNTIAWVIVTLAALISSVALTAAILWTVSENDRDKAFIKMVCTALLFVAVIFLIGLLLPIVQL